MIRCFYSPLYSLRFLTRNIMTAAQGTRRSHRNESAIHIPPITLLALITLAPDIIPLEEGRESSRMDDAHVNTKCIGRL